MHYIICVLYKTIKHLNTSIHFKNVKILCFFKFFIRHAFRGVLLGMLGRHARQETSADSGVTVGWFFEYNFQFLNRFLAVFILPFFQRFRVSTQSTVLLY